MDMTTVLLIIGPGYCILGGQGDFHGCRVAVDISLSDPDRVEYSTDELRVGNESH